MRGPLMMVALNPQSGRTKIAANSLPSLKPVPFRPQTFDSAKLDLRFAPFYTVGSETYTTYLETL
jgi:hypothetical protein